MIKDRNSNFELMRIVSMLFIILWHILIHGQVINNCTNELLKQIFIIIEFIIVVHVNSYVLITGYYQHTKNVRQSKIWQLINSSLFYKVMIIVILTLFGLINLSKVDLIREFFVLNLNEYWFVKVYLFLYFISPFLNKLINNLEKKEYKKMLVVLILIFSIIPFITNNSAYFNDGYTLTNFIILYFMGAYLKKFPIKETYIFKKYSKKSYQLILILIFFSLAIVNYFLNIASLNISKASPTLFELIGGINWLSYSNPIIIFQSIVYFMFFETLDFKNKFVDSISKTTIGIYLIHDNNYIRQFLYKWLNISNRNISSYKTILYIFVCMLLIFIVCSIIEFIRQNIFKFIYNRKISTKVRDRYYKYINSLKA